MLECLCFSISASFWPLRVPPAGSFKICVQRPTMFGFYFAKKAAHASGFRHEPVWASIVQMPDNCQAGAKYSDKPCRLGVILEMWRQLSGGWRVRVLCVFLSTTLLSFGHATTRNEPCFVALRRVMHWPCMWDDSVIYVWTKRKLCSCHATKHSSPWLRPSPHTRWVQNHNKPEQPKTRIFFFYLVFILVHMRQGLKRFHSRQGFLQKKKKTLEKASHQTTIVWTENHSYCNMYACMLQNKTSLLAWWGFSRDVDDLSTHGGVDVEAVGAFSLLLSPTTHECKSVSCRVTDTPQAASCCWLIHVMSCIQARLVLMWQSWPAWRFFRAFSDSRLHVCNIIMCFCVQEKQCLVFGV